MILSPEGLARAVASSGFREDYLEKSIRLLYLLGAIKDDPFLRSRLVLKGGTALNLFIMELPRLSVDIDLNYIGSPEREVMLEEIVCQSGGIADILQFPIILLYESTWPE